METLPEKGRLKARIDINQYLLNEIEKELINLEVNKHCMTEEDYNETHFELMKEKNEFSNELESDREILKRNFETSSIRSLKKGGQLW